MMFFSFEHSFRRAFPVTLYSSHSLHIDVSTKVQMYHEILVNYCKIRRKNGKIKKMCKLEKKIKIRKKMYKFELFLLVCNGWSDQTRHEVSQWHGITHFLLWGLVFLLLSLFSSLSSLVVSSLLASSSRSISFMSCSCDFCLPTAKSRVSNSARRSYNRDSKLYSPKCSTNSHGVTFILGPILGLTQEWFISEFWSP